MKWIDPKEYEYLPNSLDVTVLMSYLSSGSKHADIWWYQHIHSSSYMLTQKVKLVLNL